MEWLEFGEISLWANKSKTGKQPDVTGKIKLKSGQDVSVSLWKNKSENPNAPAYTGKLQVKGVATAPAPDGQPFDDEIPF